MSLEGRTGWGTRFAREMALASGRGRRKPGRSLGPLTWRGQAGVESSCLPEQPGPAWLRHLAAEHRPRRACSRCALRVLGHPTDLGLACCYPRTAGRWGTPGSLHEGEGSGPNPRPPELEPELLLPAEPCGHLQRVLACRWGSPLPGASPWATVKRAQLAERQTWWSWVGTVSLPARTVLGPSASWLCISGWPSARGDLSPSSPTSEPASGWHPESQGVPKDQSSTEWTQALASQASRFLAKVSDPQLCPSKT